VDLVNIPLNRVDWPNGRSTSVRPVGVGCDTATPGARLLRVCPTDQQMIADITDSTGSQQTNSHNSHISW
jgi:hypothetical protein